MDKLTTTKIVRVEGGSGGTGRGECEKVSLSLYLKLIKKETINAYNLFVCLFCKLISIS